MDLKESLTQLEKELDFLEDSLNQQEKDFANKESFFKDSLNTLSSRLQKALLLLKKD